MTRDTTRHLIARSALLALATLLIPAFAAPASAVTIPTVPVGNAGNASDTTGYGAVEYNYRIGKTEVTVGQYTEFLNAVAATDTYALYNTSMATSSNSAGIARSGSPNSYTYSVIGSPDRPVTYIGWGDAARFANWLHNGQSTGMQDASTTEDGAYTLNGATTHAALTGVSRNAGAIWFLPSENEWYKAAYHKNDGATGSYWQYPTSTDSVPYSDQPPGSNAPTQSNTANYFKNDGITNGYDDGYAVTGSAGLPIVNALTEAEAYSLSVSPYGTFDQGGNVSEWNESVIDGSSRGLRGGSWFYGSGHLAAPFRNSAAAGGGLSDIGFRVTTVPESGTAVLGAFAVIGLLWWRSGRK